MQCLSNKLNKYFSSGLREKWVYTMPQAMVCGRNTGIKWVWVPSLPLASYKLQNSFQDTPPTSKQGYFSTLFLRFWICNQTWVFVSSNMEKQQIRLSNSYSLRVSCVQAPLWSGVRSRDGRGDAHPYRLGGGERLKTASITNKLSAEQMMLGCFRTLTYKTNVWCCNFMFRTGLITNRNRVLWVCACACDAFYLKGGGQRIKPWQTESLHQVVKHYAGQWGLCPDTRSFRLHGSKSRQACLPPVTSIVTSPARLGPSTCKSYFQRFLQENIVYHSLLILFSLIFLNVSPIFITSKLTREAVHSNTQIQWFAMLGFNTGKIEDAGQGREWKKYFLVGWFSGLRP